jgi:hypothetical protein
MVNQSDTTLHLAYAEASVLLIESVIMLLHDRGVLSRDDLLQAVDTVIDTKQHLIDRDIHPEIARVAAGVLRRLQNSLAAATPSSEGRAGA